MPTGLAVKMKLTPDGGLRVYDGLFDPMKPFNVCMSSGLIVAAPYGWDIVGDDGEPLAKCEWIAFLGDDFELIEEVQGEPK